MNSRESQSWLMVAARLSPESVRLEGQGLTGSSISFESLLLVLTRSYVPHILLALPLIRVLDLDESIKRK